MLNLAAAVHGIIMNVFQIYLCLDISLFIWQVSLTKPLEQSLFDIPHVVHGLPSNVTEVLYAVV